MRGLTIFSSGALVAFLIQAAIAQMNPGVIQLNHVGGRGGGHGGIHRLLHRNDGLRGSVSRNE